MLLKNLSFPSCREALGKCLINFESMLNYFPHIHTPMSRILIPLRDPVYSNTFSMVVFITQYPNDLLPHL